ncbi:MAG: hypothetical protein CV087_22540 [Candidatus Brocadia sp. WS118]|nr:MAG: hypothetical protein CV087_22540 [Candidatus Brocadia sp. WS118]
MYDTVSLWQKSQSTEHIPNLLTEAKTNIIQRTGEIYSNGKLENLKVNVNSNGVSIKGSLAKFLFGNNLEQLTRKNTQLAIEKLSDSLKLPLQGAIVYRLDIGANFILKRAVSEYISLLGGVRYYKRSEIADKQTLLYLTSKRAMAFYDKVKELKRHQEPIPEVFQGRNVLRYELRFTKRLPEQLNEKKAVSVLKLYDENFYISVLEKWKSEYFKIQRLNRLKITGAIKMSSVREFVNQLALIGLTNIGGEAIALEMIENAKSNGELDKMQYKRFKDKIRELATNESYLELNEAIFELDSKVRQAVNYYR